MENNVSYNHAEQFKPCAKCGITLEMFHPWRFDVIDGKLVCIWCQGKAQGIFAVREDEAEKT